MRPDDYPLDTNYRFIENVDQVATLLVQHVIIEEPPQRRLLSIKQHGMIDMPLPWIYHYIQYTHKDQNAKRKLWQHYILFRKAPWAKEDNADVTARLAYLPNIDPQLCRVCEQPSAYEQQHSELRYFIEQIVTGFWQSEFNHDWTPQFIGFFGALVRKHFASEYMNAMVDRDAALNVLAKFEELSLQDILDIELDRDDGSVKAFSDVVPPVGKVLPEEILEPIDQAQVGDTPLGGVFTGTFNGHPLTRPEWSERTREILDRVLILPHQRDAVEDDEDPYSESW